MKSGIHPEYGTAQITCACGRVTETRTTVGEIHVEICSHCHPFFTGRQKLVDTAGRVERFKAKYGDTSQKARASKKSAAEPAAAAVATPADDAGSAESVSPDPAKASGEAESPAAEVGEGAGEDGEEETPA